MQRRRLSVNDICVAQQCAQMVASFFTLPLKRTDPRHFFSEIAGGSGSRTNKPERIPSIGHPGRPVHRSSTHCVMMWCMQAGTPRDPGHGNALLSVRHMEIPAPGAARYPGPPGEQARGARVTPTSGVGLPVITESRAFFRGAGACIPAGKCWAGVRS